MNLLERDTFLTEFDARLADAATGRGSLIFVGGEAGIGKSALVTHFGETVRSAARVLTGACDPLSTPRPLAPLSDVAAALHGDVERLLLAGAPRDEVFRAVLAALAEGPRPALVIFEDVHWADEATLDLLRFLGRRIGNTRALLLATYRDDEVGPRHPLRVALGDLASMPAVRRVLLPRLSEEAVHALALESTLDPGELYRQTGGNPFFVTEVLDAGGLGLPATVRDAVLGRAARLSPDSRAALDAAALIGARVEPWLLAEVLGAEAVAAEACVAAGVLRVEGNSLAFRHELARVAVLEAIPPGRALHLHRAILAALRSNLASTNDSARLAHHAEAADDRDATLTYATAAAREAITFSAHREAAAQYARALRAAGSLEPQQRACLLEAFSRECYVTERHEEALRASRDALAIWRAEGNRLREGEALSSLASQLVMSGKNTAAEEASRASLAILEALPHGPALAMAYRTQAHLRMLNRDTADAIDWGGRAIALAEQFQSQETLIGAFNSVGSAMLVAGNMDGLVYLERSCELARAAGSHDQVALALGNLGSALGEQYHFDLASQYLDAGIAYSTEHEIDRHRLYAQSWQALCRMYQGRWDAATAHARQVTHFQSSSAISRIMALVALGRVRTRRGDPEVASVLDEALSLAMQTETLQRLAPVCAARAEAASLAGDTARMRDEAQAVFAIATRHEHAWFMSELGYWLWRAGERVDLEPSPTNPFILQIKGDWAGAAARWEQLGCPYEAARALAESDDEGALRRALATFEALGARPMAQAVARQLREQGVRAIPRGPRPSTRANPAGLTRREVEVLGLLANDLRNAQIAARLSLSPKTVEHHISSILAKLDARSRSEAVRLASRRDLLPQSGGGTTPK